MLPVPSRPLRALAAGAVALTAAVAVAPPASAAPAPQQGPCPFVSVPRPPGAKPLPPIESPPARPADAPVLGGDDFDTDGLLAPAGPKPPAVTARSWVVADLDTGEILAACAPHARHQPASTQKLLTVLTTLPKVDLNQTVTITQDDLNFERGSSAVGLVKGGKYTLQTILLGLLLNSGNDAANVLARAGGDGQGVPGTVAAMNAEAKRIGALDTKAVTPSGLDGPGQFTSAYDLALIARADFALPAFAKATATQRASMPAQPPRFKGFQIQNDNRLLTAYPGAIGGKTGFTDVARHTFVGAAQRGGRRLLVTMLRAENRPTKPWQQAAALLDWGFAQPRGAQPVGHLVTPEEVAPPGKPPGKPAGGAVGGAQAAVVPPGGAQPPKRVEQIGLALGATTLAFALFTVFWQTRRRLRARRRRRAVATRAVS